MEGVSIIICCYNSSARISKTLGFLAKQIVPISIPWEVLIVDNNCNDNTVEIASKEWCKYNLETKLKIVYQPQSGLSYARQKGVEISSFDYVIFCDDDNWLNENYIEIAYRILNSNKSISALGGKIKAVADVDFPDFWSKFSEHFAVGNQLPQTGFANQRKYLWGAGLTMRKYDYLCVSRQESLLQDRKGKELSSGGDSEICARLLLFGKDLYYSDKLLLLSVLAKLICQI